MGYCIELGKSTIRITKTNAEKIMEVIKNYINAYNPDWRWVNNAILVARAEEHDFEEFMYELRYSVYVEEDGRYAIDYLAGEKLGDDEDIFKLIAEFIDDGYIEILGEEGNRWRYTFTNGVFETKYPKIEW